MSGKTSVLDAYPAYRVDIGIEVHVQLTTKSKIFCTCSNGFATEPNINICETCSGQPGALPRLNAQVVEYAIMTGLATNCAISPESKFDRKHYFYPDLPKDFQITQNDLPICTDGFVTIHLEDGTKKNIRLIRIHMEEDAGKNIHAQTGESFVDLNRAGTPLLEIVSYPDINSAYEARAYLQMLHKTVKYLNVSTGNMEEGAFRADTNISVRKKEDPNLGTKVELKNINSFKFIGDAIEYEIERQIELLEDGGRVKQETRLWDTKERKSVPMRSKEELADYRYFSEPDLPIVAIDQKRIDAIKAVLPELPAQKLERLMRDKNLSTYEAEILVDAPELANYFEKAYSINPSKQIINWILRDLLSYLKEEKIELEASKVTPEKLAELVSLIDRGTINNRAAQEIFIHVAQSGKNPTALVKELGLEQVGASAELESMIKELVAAHPEQTAQYKAGQQKLFGFFVGVAMQKTQGKGNPKVIQELLKKYLS
ncbi:MAG TPA: Asp-tRNA(Asn)/Glu-tRNA(Gln) amidotransferase subunit GatB [Candidatus Babeliales bacterium]|nr:Asp-tRNA(Asn)/Glu-tRNA(Gln) amidotransferase subunit GatB [Candidatus Babeliales bacterium]